MGKWQFVSACAVAMAGFAISAQAAPFVDTLDNLDNISQEGTGATLTIDSGKLTVSRVSTLAYASFGWNIGGTGAANSNLSMHPADGQTILKIDGIQSNTTPLLDIFLDGTMRQSGSFSYTTGLYELDIAHWAANNFPTESFTNWSIRVGVTTYGSPDYTFTMDTISAVPEPTSLAALGLGAVLLTRRTRRQQP